MTKIKDVEFKKEDIDFRDNVLLEKENNELKMRIIDLIKENSNIKKELEKFKTLENMNIQSVENPLIGADNRFIGSSDQETICRVQLNLLNNISMLRELSIEETKKVEIFTKLLLQIVSSKKKQPDTSLDTLSDSDLLKIVSEIQ